MNDVSAYELISAYFDGELPEDARVEAERLLVENADLRRWYQQLKAMRGALGSLPKYRLEADFAQKVLRRAEIATLQGQMPEAPADDQAVSPETEPTPQPAAPQDSTGGAGGSGVEGTGAAARNGRSSARWDAPLWIAIAASVCIYVSLAGRESTKQPASETVAMQRGGAAAPQAKRVPEAGRAETVEVFQPLAADAPAMDDAAISSIQSLPARAGGLGEPNAVMPTAKPAMEAASHGLNAPSGFSPAQHPAEARNVIQDRARMPAPAAAREAAPFRAEPYAPASTMAAPSEAAETMTVPADAASLAIVPRGAGVAAAATAPPGEVLICETLGDAEGLIAQFEAALAAESIVLASPHAQAGETARDKRASEDAAASKREAVRSNRQRAQQPGAAPDEVLVYVVEASDEQLTRLKARLQQLPDTLLRESMLPAPQAASAAIGGPLHADPGSGAGIPSGEVRALATPSVVNRGTAKPQPDGIELFSAPVASPQMGNVPQVPEAASRRAVIILRAPRAAP